MSLKEEMWKYEQITGESAEHVPIIKLGAFLDGYEMGVKALEQTRWIPVRERLPEDGEYVLLYYERDAWIDNDCIRKKDIDKGWQIEGRWHVYGASGVVGIAWMPLPERCKVESEDEGSEGE